jgi:hypothetical protein
VVFYVLGLGDFVSMQNQGVFDLRFALDFAWKQVLKDINC